MVLIMLIFQFGCFIVMKCRHNILGHNLCAHISLTDNINIIMKHLYTNHWQKHCKNCHIRIISQITSCGTRQSMADLQPTRQKVFQCNLAWLVYQVFHYLKRLSFRVWVVLIYAPVFMFSCSSLCSSYNYLVLICGHLVETLSFGGL